MQEKDIKAYRRCCNITIFLSYYPNFCIVKAKEQIILIYFINYLKGYEMEDRKQAAINVTKCFKRFHVRQLYHLCSQGLITSFGLQANEHSIGS